LKAEGACGSSSALRHTASRAFFLHQYLSILPLVMQAAMQRYCPSNRGRQNVAVGSISIELGCPRHVRSTPISDRIADIPDRQLRAKALNRCAVAR
ncbi:MAG: hypothetical protein WB420_17685, partial [Bradyrhizobium sp.]